MNIAALRHRPESEDCFLYDQDLLVLRLHTAKGDARRVSLIYGDPYMTVTDAATTTLRGSIRSQIWLRSVKGKRTITGR